MIAMLKLGASKPWPEALRVLTGETRMDATAIIDYYKPLTDWLAAQNKGETCGWVVRAFTAARAQVPRVNPVPEPEPVRIPGERLRVDQNGEWGLEGRF